MKVVQQLYVNMLWISRGYRYSGVEREGPQEGEVRKPVAMGIWILLIASCAAPHLSPTPMPALTVTWAWTPTPAPSPMPTPTCAPITYVVQPGDTLTRVAIDRGTTAEALCTLNALTDCSLIYPGQKLLIPCEGLTPMTATPSPTSMPTFTPKATSTPVPTVALLRPFYGMEFVPQADLGTVKGLGIEVVLWPFSYDGTPENWLAYLDEAQAHGIKVIARLWPEGWNWEGTTWQIDDQARSFISTVAEHPATFAVYALEEPYWQGCWGCGYTTYEQQLLYNAIKAIAAVPVFSEIDSMSFWTGQGEETAFADGICDYCATWYYAFEDSGSYRRDELVSRLSADLSVVRDLAPKSKFVWLMQSFAQTGSYRMPTASEMQDLASIVYSMDVDGALWYCWWFESLYSDFLSTHTGLYPIVREIYEENVLPRKR